MDIITYVLSTNKSKNDAIEEIVDLAREMDVETITFSLDGEENITLAGPNKEIYKF